MFKVFAKKFQGCHKKVLRAFQECFKVVSRKFHLVILFLHGSHRMQREACCSGKDLTTEKFYQYFEL